MKNVVLIPLDSRPCNTIWLRDFAERAGFNLKMYPREQCGNLIKGADSEAMFTWLESELPSADYVIISADGISSGGLIQARLGTADPEMVMKKIEILKYYKNSNHNLKFYLFDTIMRTSITAYDQESEIYWSKMNEYSRLLGNIYFFHKDEDQVFLQTLEKEIPNSIIQRYLQARKIKHQLNEMFLRMVSEDIADYLLLLQEDAMPYGIQKAEQDQLFQLAEDLKIQDRVAFYNGTDEGGAVLLGKIILEASQIKPKIFIHTPLPDSLNKIMHFEDRPFSENIGKMFNTIGFIKTGNPDEADMILSLYTEETNYDLDLNSTVEILPKKDLTYYRYLHEIHRFFLQNKKVAFVDLLFPNGGSPEILKDFNCRLLASYSAWNTASNSLGSCLCDMACVLTEKSHDQHFLYERILDDCIYQYLVRRMINEKYCKKGYNIHNLGDHYPEVLDEIGRLLKQYSQFLGNVNYTFSLPWKRTFEIEIKVGDIHEV